MTYIPQNHVKPRFRHSAYPSNSYQPFRTRTIHKRKLFTKSDKQFIILAIILSALALIAIKLATIT